MNSVHANHRLWVAAAVAAALAIAGCGSDKSYKNRPRPASPIILTASIGKDRVSVSPTRFGAGPITLVVTNQTQTAQQVTIDAGGQTQQTGPIYPQDTASIKADVGQGSATVRVQGGGIRAAHLRIGPKRPSAQNDLLQP